MNLPVADTRHSETCSSGNSITPLSIPMATLPMFFTASIIFFALDATINLLKGHTVDKPVAAVASRPLTHVVNRSRRILADVEVLEEQLTMNRIRCQRLLKRRQRRRDFSPLPASRKPPSYEFTALCERLILVNRIWNQEREIKSLRSSSTTSKPKSKSKSKPKSSSEPSPAFLTLLDQLLLHNRLWALERTNAELTEEKARVERERGKAIESAARWMVGGMRRDAEKEVEKEKERSKEKEEAENLRLALEAKRVEQELANDVEDRLVKRVKALEERLRVGAAAEDDLGVVSEAPSDFSVSTSSTATCVSLQSPPSYDEASLEGNFPHTPDTERKPHTRPTPISVSTPRKRTLSSVHSYPCSVPNTANTLSTRPLAASQASGNGSKPPTRTWTRTRTISAPALAPGQRASTLSASASASAPTTPPAGSTFVRNGTHASASKGSRLSGGGIRTRAPWR